MQTNQFPRRNRLKVMLKNWLLLYNGTITLTLSASMLVLYLILVSYQARRKHFSTSPALGVAVGCCPIITIFKPTLKTFKT